MIEAMIRVPSLPVDVISPEKREMILTNVIESRLPNVDFDKVAVYEEHGGVDFYWLMVCKDGKVIHIPLDREAGLTEEVLAQIVLFAG